MGQKKGTDGGGFWAADGTGYGHGLEEKLKGKQREKKRETGRKEKEEKKNRATQGTGSVLLVERQLAG